MNDKHDFREETNLNAVEEVALNWLAGKLGISKSATLRLGMIRLVEQAKREEALHSTGLVSGE